MLAADAEQEEVLRAGEAGGPGAREDDANLVDRLTDQLERVEESGTGDDRRAVLVVVEDGYVAAALALLLDEEALGRTDVLEVDAAERGRERADDLDQALR